MAKILLVEDDLPFALQVKDAFELKDYLVDLAHSSSEARAYLSAAKYDLVVLAWGLPDAPGIDLCQEIRSSQVGNVPVLFLTGRSQMSDKQQGFDCGADDYLTKPFHIEAACRSANKRLLSRVLLPAS